jgi:hypothetical protein
MGLHERLNQNSLFNKNVASETFYLKNFNLKEININLNQHLAQKNFGRIK